MSHIDTSWWISGGMILVAVLYVLMINMLPIMDRVNVRKVVKRTGKEENREFLIQNASYHNFASKHWYWGLLLTVFEVVILLRFEGVYTIVEGYEETYFSIAVSIVFAIIFVVHGMVGVIGIIFVLCMWGDENRRSLQVRDFLTAQEISLMRLVKSQMRERTGVEAFDEEDYRNEGGMSYWTVHMPDELIPVMKAKVKLAEYHQVERKLWEMEDIDKSLLTPEQLKRNEQFEQQFYESVEVLEPHLEQIKLATDKAHFQAEEKKKLNKTQIRQDFDQKQAEAERALMALNDSIRFDEAQEKENQPVHEAIRELKRVSKSELVSPELKEQASSLIERIEEKQNKMRNQQEKELVDRDALTIIRANELFYGLTDTDIT